jgi:hypothetical protein
MSSHLRITVDTVGFALMFSANASVVRGQQKLLTAEQTQIVNTVSTIFTAASTEDIAKFDSVIAADFYIFANGRFNGDAIMGVIKALHAAGKRYDEHVTEPDIQISGDTAWIAYVNKGSITDASGTINQEWLEIGLPAERGRHLEDRVHAQHPLLRRLKRPRANHHTRFPRARSAADTSMLAVQSIPGASPDCSMSAGAFS